MQWISDTDSPVCSEDDSFIAIVLAREHTNRKRTLNSIHEESAGPSTHDEDTSAKPNQDAQRHVVMHLEEEEEEEEREEEEWERGMTTMHDTSIANASPEEANGSAPAHGTPFERYRMVHCPNEQRDLLTQHVAVPQCTMSGEGHSGGMDGRNVDEDVAKAISRTLESSAPAPGTLYSAIKECTPKRRTDGSENLIRI